MADNYVIQFIKDGQPIDRCIGVNAIQAGAPVVLSLLGASDHTVFHMDPNTGYISSVKDPSLCIDIQAPAGSGSQLVLSKKVIGKTTQRWNWLGAPPRIFNVGLPTLCIDDYGNGTNPGNKIIAYDQSGGAQSWQTVPADLVAAEEKPRKAAAG